MPAQTAAEFWKEYNQDWVRALRELGIKAKMLKRLDNGTWEVDLSDSTISDLKILHGAPIRALWLRNTVVSDLSPLEKIALTRLDLGNTPVTDLTALRSPTLSSSLREVFLSGTRVTDYSPLAACTKMVVLDATDSALADLAVVRGRKLRFISVANTKVTEISELAGMPLTRVLLRGTGVTDVSPLLQCPTLVDLVLPAGARNVGALRALPALKTLSYDNNPGGMPAQTAAEFWKEYDARKK